MHSMKTNPMCGAVNRSRWFRRSSVCCGSYQWCIEPRSRFWYLEVFDALELRLRRETLSWFDSHRFQEFGVLARSKHKLVPATRWQRTSSLQTPYSIRNHGVCGVVEYYWQCFTCYLRLTEMETRLGYRLWSYRGTSFAILFFIDAFSISCLFYSPSHMVH